MSEGSEVISNQTDNYYPLLLEIGTEEIPARFLPDACIKLKEISEKIFSENRLLFQSIKTYSTPRRIVLYAELSDEQYALEKEIWGPPVNVAFDSSGNPTKAAEIFARSNGVDISSLQKKEKGKGLYVVAFVKEITKKTTDILPDILPRIIYSISFPKSMRWGDSNLRFARPIHWILSIYNNKKIDFEIDGINSSNTTRGHRFLSPASFEIKDVKNYIVNLRNNFVIVDPEERKKIIMEGANKIASSISLDAKVVEDIDLLNHVAYLVEYPVITVGGFSEEYLLLPKELLITVMKGHQKYFAIEDRDGKLINSFLIVSNTRQENSDTVRKGAERVIRARFEDAKFYYDLDRKTPSVKRLEGLKKVIYHDRLGSLYDKALRISKIADFLSERFYPEKREDVQKAALLSKTDLISGVVGEFPELQGIMGSYYALNDGYSEEIAKAIREQYLPAHSKDRLPETPIGIILSISDKLDNIISFFLLGLAPTGTEDPFALRRQALGIISILLDKRLDISLDELIENGLKIFVSFGFEVNLSALKQDLLKFFEQRISPLFTSEGFSYDVIDSVITFIKDTPLWTVKERLNAIEELKKEPDYEQFLLSIKRINNIAPKDDYERVVNVELFEQKEEGSLYEEIRSLSSQVEGLLSENRYNEAIRALTNLKDPINRFFDKVLVMDKREEIKNNRLALVKAVQRLAFKIADFSKLV
jgi:glycyl-tRNA synthetase beta chain